VTGSRWPGRRARIAASALGAGVAALAVLAACSAGQITQTSNQVPGIPGVNASASPNTWIALRDLTIEYNSPAGYAEGESAPLVVRIFNTGDRKITLIGVDAGDAAAGVEIADAGGTTTGDAATTSASTSASAGPATATPTPSGARALAVDIDPSGYALLVPGEGPYLRLVGLARPLRPGDSVPLTFRFSDGSTALVSVPFGVPDEPAPRATPVAPHEEEGVDAAE
jgi:copper(I)-binding protein